MAALFTCLRNTLQRYGQVTSLIFRSLLLVALSACAACTTLPTSGPTEHVIQAAAKPGKSSVPYEIVEITPDVSAREKSGAGSPDLERLSDLAAFTPPPRVDIIREGDTLSLAIFEVGVSLFGLTASAEEMPTARGQPFTARVDENGNISLPYIGTVRAAGETSQDLANVIRSRLRQYSESPAVLVNIAATVGNTVYVDGEIGQPGRYPLTAAHEKLLDLIAIAGGVKTNVNNVEVRFVRHGQAVVTRLNNLTAESPANLTLVQGDRITLLDVPKTFTVFGAAQQVSQIPFTSQRVTLAEAIARAAGPNDSRANPRGVFLFRLERNETDGQPVAVVYQLNLMKPEAYFLAQMFEMQDKDVLLVSNSRSNITAKLIGLINQLFSPVFATTNLINATN